MRRRGSFLAGSTRTTRLSSTDKKVCQRNCHRAAALDKRRAVIKLDEFPKVVGKLLDVDTGELLYNTGGIKGTCPRTGWARLSVGVPGTHMSRSIRMSTTCKTWRCLPCRARMIALFIARVETGVLDLGPCMLITITYKADSHDRGLADFVGADWRAFCRRMAKHEGPLWKPLRWIRVVELTQKGVPHHHLVAGPTPPGVRVNCWGRAGFQWRQFQDAMPSCLCVAHRFARQWLEVTNDSWIIHAMPVSSALGAGHYLAKYISKTLGRDNRSVVSGMRRRWSSSRGWPGSGRLRLARSESAGGRGWDSVSFGYGFLAPSLAGGPEDLLVRSGLSITGGLAKRAHDFRQIKRALGVK